MKVIALSYGIVAVGGALGAMARVALNVFLQRDIAFPWGTLGANLIGRLVLAALLASFALPGAAQDTPTSPFLFRVEGGGVHQDLGCERPRVVVAHECARLVICPCNAFGATAVPIVHIT